MNIPDRGPRQTPGVLTARFTAFALLAFSVHLFPSLQASPQGTGNASKDKADSPATRLILLRRSIAQDQGAWVIEYQLRFTGPTGVVLLPSEVRANIEGWVSNSRIASHAVPRFTHMAVGGTSGNSGTGDVIISTEESQRCRQRVVLSIWTDEVPPSESDMSPLLSVAPGALVHARFRLEHQHVLYGDYDPLLGIQIIELALGGAILRDQVPLDREHYLAQPKYTWPEPPDDRRDTHHFVSAPDSLHLEAHIPGHQYYRYPERPVRYGTRLRLRFWYLIAAGTEGECRVRFAQYKETPSSWHNLNGGGFEQALETIGSWTKVERVIRAESEATSAAIDFRIISETNVGEMWIDNVSLEPMANTGPADSP